MDTQLHLLDRDRLQLTGCVVPFGTRRVDGGYADAESAIYYEPSGAPVYLVDYDDPDGDHLIGYALKMWRQDGLHTQDKILSIPLPSSDGLYANIELYAEHPDTPGVLAAVEAGKLFFCYEQSNYALYRASDALDGYLPTFAIGGLRLVEFPHYTPDGLSAAEYLQHLREHERAVQDWTAERASRPVRRVGSALPDAPVYHLESVNTDIPPQTVAPPTQAIVPKDGSTVLAWDQNAARAVITTAFLKSANPPWREITPGTVGAGTWTQTFDFSVNDGGWVIAPSPPGYYSPTSYSAGAWRSGTSGSDQVLGIQIAFSGPRTVTSVRVVYVKGAADAFQNEFVKFLLSGSGVSVNNLTEAAGSYDQTFSVNQQADTAQFFLDCSGTALQSYVTKIVITGTGSSPFAGGSGTTITHINHADFDIFPGSGGKVAAYLLADDGTNSFVFRAEDVNATPPDWVLGASITGLFKVLRLTSVKGTIQIEAPAVGGNTLVATSTDYGQTWASVTAGVSGGSDAGFDAMQLFSGTVSVVSTSGGQIKKSTSIGGAFSNVGAALIDIAYLVIPWRKRASDNTNNSGTSPEFIVGLSALSGGASLLWDDGSGTRTDVTPVIAAVKGLFNGPDSITLWRSQHIAIVASFTGVPHVLTSVNAGGTWTDRGAVTAASFIRVRRRATSAAQLFWNKTGGVIQYTHNFGVSIVSKQTSLSTVSGFDVYN